MEPTYVYRAECERVIDGDTFIARIDLGFRVAVSIPVRVRGLWCPELRDRGGLSAKAAAHDLLRDGFDEPSPLVLQSFHDARSFERWVCDVWLPAGGGLFADAMIASGHGRADR